MAQKMSYVCDSCGARIEDAEYPFVVYQVVGIVPMHPMADPSASTDVSVFPLPRSVQQVLAKSVPRIDRCLMCHAWETEEDLVDVDGNVVVVHADHVDRISYVTAAGQTLAAARQALLSPPQTEAVTDATVTTQPGSN